MSKAYFMGIDTGTNSSKGVLINELGEIVAVSSTTHAMTNPAPNHFEHDAEKDWWGDLCIIARDLIQKSGVDPKDIKALGREVKNFDAMKWSSVSKDIVVKGNLHKFAQNMDLFHFLHETGNKVLVEASPYDTIWGIGMQESDEGIINPHNWKGLNQLGFALMEVRDDLIIE